MTTTTQNPFQAFTASFPAFNAQEQVGAFLKQAQDGAHLWVKVTQSMMTEMDRQGADALRYVQTAQEQAVAARGQALKAFAEMVDRGVEMQRDAFKAFSAQAQAK